MPVCGGDQRERSTTEWNLSACPPFDFGLQCSALTEQAFFAEFLGSATYRNACPESMLRNKFYWEE
jgi:hypothetical protein